MAYGHTIARDRARHNDPTIRKIGPAEIFDALARGIADFNERPSHVMFLTAIYPIVAFLLARLAFGYDLLPLLYPLAAGFALVGPVATIGLYEISRQRELGVGSGRGRAVGVLRSPSLGAIVLVALLLVGIFALWILTAQGIYRGLFGDASPDTFGELAGQVLTTPQGWALVLVGNAVGFPFALAVLAVGGVSIPLLLDRDVGVAAAIAASVRAVLVNPAAMLLWGLVVAVALLVGSLPLFVGLCVVLPVLGHSTWHLYRKVVAW